MSFSRYKEAEAKLQAAVEPLGYNVTIEPITATDLYYSDGSAIYSHGKAAFVFKQNTKEFLVFLPDLYCYFGIPPPLKEILTTWLKELV
jgi:hypothetical protein